MKECKTNMISKDFSKKVTMISFFMSILVMYIHANNISYYNITPCQSLIASVITKIVGTIIAGIAVPYFFMMSGYWFFRTDTQELMSRGNPLSKIWNKLKGKVITLLVPYLLWNIFGMLFYMAITRVPIISSMMNNSAVVEVTFENVVEGVLFNKYYFHFWYLQDLIVLMLLTPLFTLILRNKVLSIISISAVAICNMFSLDLIVVNSSSILFFLVGGALAIYIRDFWEVRGENGVLFAFAFLILCSIRFIGLPILSNICYYLSPIVFWKLSDLLLPKRIVNRNVNWFCKQSFFIYAAHVIPITTIGHLMAKICQNFLWMQVSFFLAPWITLFLLFLAAKFLYRFIPGFYKVICGNRG